MFFSLKDFIFLICLLFFMLRLKRTRYIFNLNFHNTLVNVTNKVDENNTIAVDIFDEVGTGLIETEITCKLLKYEIINYISNDIDDLKRK